MKKVFAKFYPNAPKKSPSPHSLNEGNLLDFLGLRHHPASSTLRSCVGDMSKGCQGLPALTNAVKVEMMEMEGVAKVEKTWGGCDTVDIQ